MQLKPEEISKIIRAQIKHYENAIEQSETGTVIMVGDGIARASGLEKCMAGELLQFDNGEYGMAQNLEENTVSIVLLGSDAGIKEGGIVKRTGKVVSVPVGDAMIGRVVNALGQPIDGAGPIETTEYRAIESRAPGIIERQPVKEPLQTGIKAIVYAYELARQTGKRAIFTERVDNVMTLKRFAIHPGEKCIIAEDVVTTGISSLETKRVIEEAGGICLGITCVVDRTKPEAPSPIPILASALKLDLPNYAPEECPICREGKLPLVHLGSRKMKEQAKQTL